MPNPAYLNEFDRHVSAFRRLNSSGYLSNEQYTIGVEIAIAAMSHGDINSPEEFSSLDTMESKLFDRLQPGLQDAVYATCVKGIGMDESATQYDWPQRTTKVLLKYGLEAMVEML